ncbi:MAG: hypothetical protein AB8B95_03115 [Pseudohongiellaceae bacterium]
MKKLSLGISLIVALLLSHTVAADGRHWNRGFDNGRFASHSNRNFRVGRVNNYHYGRAGSRRGNNFIGASWGRAPFNNHFYNTGFNNRRFNRGGFNRGFNDRRFVNRNFNRGFGSNRFNHRNRWGAESFVGGLVVGSLLNSASNRATTRETVRYRSAPIVTNRQVIRTNSTGRVASPPQPSHRLLRDLQGDCFEIVTTVNGDELRSQVDPSLCEF